MAVDFKDLEARLVNAPVRLRRRSARAPAPTVLAPTRVVDLTVEPVILPVPAPVAAARTTARADDASYWVRRRRAEAQAADQG